MYKYIINEKDMLVQKFYKDRYVNLEHYFYDDDNYLIGKVYFSCDTCQVLRHEFYDSEWEYGLKQVIEFNNSKPSSQIEYHKNGSTFIQIEFDNNAVVSKKNIYMDSISHFQKLEEKAIEAT